MLQQTLYALQERDRRDADKATWDRRLAIASLVISALTAATMVYTLIDRRR